MEQGVNRLKQGHGIAPRDEKRTANHWAIVVLAALLLPLGRRRTWPTVNAPAPTR
ncbi:MAG: hypothetical protein M3Q71_25185 [Chloroflexota bacterium]|nr:hypothetical protein [Chloroflexota bacterium]